MAKKESTREKRPQKGGNKVSVSTLTVGQQFEHEGKTYVARRAHPVRGVRAMTTDGTNMEYLPPGTLVTPI